jgi:hypothetical protein
VRISPVKKLDFEPIKSGATPSIVCATGITAAQADGIVMAFVQGQGRDHRGPIGCRFAQAMRAHDRCPPSSAAASVRDPYGRRAQVRAQYGPLLILPKAVGRRASSRRRTRPWFSHARTQMDHSIVPPRSRVKPANAWPAVEVAPRARRTGLRQLHTMFAIGLRIRADRPSFPAGRRLRSRVETRQGPSR